MDFTHLLPLTEMVIHAMHEYSKKQTKSIFFQTEYSRPDKAGSMISFGDVEVARINLGAGLMASSRPWLCLSYESLDFIDFLFWKLVYLASGINKNKLQLSCCNP